MGDSNAQPKTLEAINYYMNVYGGDVAQQSK